ncbi:MAG: CHASE2 domain-containing protein [Candidatus Omnitrophica bacterium]|nr:CHASE2 domain-containing protein [Candidatus Omnitrophota bacterium]
MSPNPKGFALQGPDRFRLLITVAILAAVLFFQHFHILDRFEYVTYDLRMILKSDGNTDKRICVIEISDESIAAIGRWPWDRAWHSALLKALKEAGAKAVIFDVIFSEPSDPEKDAGLAQAIAESGNVYLAEADGLESLPEFRAGMKGSGHIHLNPDKDGVMRRIPLFMDFGGKKIPQLSLAYFLKGEIAAQETISRIPLDIHGNLLIFWAGRWKETFKHYSFLDVVASYALTQKGSPSPLDLKKEFAGKICFVGTTATGLFDIRPTPLEPSYPAVGVNLTVLNNIFSGHFIREAGAVENLLILFCIAGLLSLILHQQSFFRGALWTLLLALFYTITATVLFIVFGLWISLVYPLLLIFGTYFFATIINQITVTVERAKLYKMATRDTLTSLYNIGHFKLLFKAEMATVAMRREKKLSLLMADVDNFKKTNDTYGHLTGDVVLREVANTVKANCRALDVAARYGGEEFILMLPGADEEMAFKIAEKIRKSVEQKIFSHEKGDFSTTISIGVTEVRAQDGDEDSVIGRADQALYEAKHSGKNRVMIAKK